MRAVVCEGYGDVNLCGIRDMPVPEVGNDQVLIRIRAASVNRSDWESVVGRPAYARSGRGGLRGKARVLGTDVAGEVVQIGANVTRFQEGDQVFGDLMYGGGGTFAEYSVASESATLAKLPSRLTLEQASALPQSGVIAVQALRARSGVATGDSILLNGGGGGTGVIVTQLAKKLGVQVTGVDTGAKFDVMRRAGADHVVDFQADDYTRSDTAYNRIIDFVGSRSVFANRRALSDGGVYLLVGGAVRRLLGAAGLGRAISAVGKRHMGMLLVRPNVADLEEVAGEVIAGGVDPMIERTYTLDEAPQALARLGANEALGKLVITVG